MRPVGNSMTAESSTSTRPKRVLSKQKGMGTVSLVSGLAQEVHERRLDDARPGLERGLVGGLLGVELDQRLRDVDVLGLRELGEHAALQLGEAAERPLEAVLARAVERAGPEHVVE